MRSDLRLQVSVRKLACVLDPDLLLCDAQGPTLALRLTQVMEPWLTRSFWQALDSSELLLSGPEAGERGAAAPLQPSALAAWIALRETTDAGSWLFRWIGDRLAESQVQDATDADALERYEGLVDGLSRRRVAHSSLHAGWCLGFDRTVASLDALALSATLDGALVLCRAESGSEPGPVLAARSAELRTTLLEPMPADSLFNAERMVVRQALASAGLAPLLEDRTQLAAVHVALPSAEGAAADDAASGSQAVWTGARVWWYPV
jgi:hypothetical protein